MPRRIVIHAGFHKTGTSTVQQVLRQNRTVLKPHLRSLLKWSMKDVLHASRGFSTWRDPLTLHKFARRFRALMQAQSNMPRRTLCLSAEELSGHMPGREGIPDYSAAPILAREMARVAQSVFPDTEVVFYYSTRDPVTWLESAYWEHVKSSSMTMAFDAFRGAFPNAAPLDDVVKRVAQIQPFPVHSERVETYSGALAAPLLSLCGVPDETIHNLTPVPAANSRKDTVVLQALLDANRRYSNRDERKAAKQAILNREIPRD